MEKSKLTRKEILRMVQAGQLSAQEGMQLLAGLEDRPAAPAAAADPGDLREPFEHYLRELIAAETKLAPSAILPNQSFEKFGIDSVLVVNLNRQLESQFGDLSKTLFFEYQTLRDLAGYFLREHAEKVRELVGRPAATSRPARQAPAEAPQPAPPKAATPRFAAAPQPRQATRPAAQPAAQPAAPGGIAIVGVHGRYPGARDLDEFWDVLKAGKDCITEIPRERWDHGKYFDPDKSKPGKVYAKWGGFLEGADQFDPLFFNVSPSEAEFMDPQERLFLQTVWHTLEDAGYTRSQLAGRPVGVFVGVMYGHYQLFGAELSLLGTPTAYGQSYASIANRVSYWFDFQGPSIGLDTMCSSSLTSIHLACEAIRRGECEMALAGGVNLSIHVNKYVLLSATKFLASDGRCRSFGEGGDGYVPGEGVGAVLLKPLDRAVADGDQIYAVIKGSSLNHGGKTSGYTVPNPNAQGALIADALTRAHIDPRTFSYLEAHGTGTSLGDPIEITGLLKSFGPYTQERQYCAIGSVKSNIGHLESAAGIAGITKVLLQMKHKQMVPSIHSETLNPNIDFAASPFRVQRELAEWRRPVIIEDGVAVEYPRRAGVSSFGAGGSNAHIILEEYTGPEAAPAVDEPGPHLIVLSARAPERLKECARRLAAFLESDQGRGLALADIAYTLQVCREEMSERIAAVVTSVDELRDVLQAYVQGKRGIRQLLQSETDGAARLGLLFDGEDGRRFLQELLDQRKLDRLAQLWVAGVALDWRRVYDGRQPQRVALPLYPFAQERYWAPPIDTALLPGAGQAALHPLVDANASTLQEQCYTKRLHPDQFYLRDHVVGRRMLLPGAVYMEMARAAGELAMPGQRVTGLSEIAWEHPIAVASEPVDARISLLPDETGVAWQISTGGEMDEPTVHARGRLLCEEEAAPPLLDLNAVKARCTTRVDGGLLYRELSAAGLQYGEHLQSVRELLAGELECLARLELHAELAESFSEYGLHPALLDGALQAVAPLAAGSKGVYLPAAVSELRLLAPLPPACWVYVSRQADAEDVKRFDISLCDEQGRMLVAIHGLSVVRSAQPALPAPAETDLPLYLTSEWEPAPLAESSSPARNMLILTRDDAILKQPGATAPEHAVLVLPGDSFREITPGQVYAVNPQRPEEFGALLGALRERNWAPQQVVDLWPEPQGQLTAETAAAQMDGGVYPLLFLTQALMQEKLPGAVPMLYVFAADAPDQQPVHGAVGGFARTVMRENPGFVCKAVELAGGAGALPRPLWSVLRDELEGDAEAEVRYHGGRRYVRRLREYAMAPDHGQLPVRSGGVYLITGGLGGLGLVFARHLARQAPVKLILVGRSALDAARQKALRELEQLGAEALYLQADVADAAAVAGAVQAGEARFGTISGVLHSAGVLRDSFVLKKTRAEMDAVLAPKLFGTLALWRALAGRTLDFFVLFSSTTAVLGNLGQCDYAFANSFLDRFPHALPAGGPAGPVIAVNWPFWADGGMSVDQQTLQLLEEKAGIVPLQQAAGIRALAGGLRSGLSQLALIPGDHAKIRRAIGLGPAVTRPAGATATVTVTAAAGPTGAAPANPAPSPAAPADRLAQQTEALLKSIFAKVLKLAPARIAANDPFERYGIDSIRVMDLTRHLEEQFGELPKTLFFQYQTLGELADYFVTQHEQTLRELFRTAEPSPSPALLAPPAPLPGGAPALARPRAIAPVHRFQPAAIAQKNAGDDPMAIAIVGLAGRYPGAKDMDGFWEVLRDGRDCIREISGERWDHSAYFDPVKGKRGKTYSRWGGFIDGVDRFDPLFFSISPLEAEHTDPQERLFLQTVWHTLEDAGYTRARLAGCRTGVFVGVMFGQYQLYGAEESARGNVIALSSSYASIANRVSYFMGFRGPSMAVDTMCSSSLTAIHLACQSLQRGESDVAVAGGVNLITHPNKYILLSQSKFLSSDGRCRAFGEGGDGYVPGEGIGAVLLKPLHRAVADGDRIYGVIRGTCINHGGKVNGYTVPNPNAQAEVVAGCLKAAGVEPGSISYVEAHGTGTSLGDPIEIAGLTQAFGPVGKQVCAIGSVKSNVGHLESAAGIAGLTKVLLQMQHGQLVPSLHADRQNPHIDFKNTPFHVQRELTAWRRTTLLEHGLERAVPRRAAISSFGAGGANAHLIVEEYVAPVTEGPEVSSGEQVVLLSAKTADRLREQARQLLEHIRPAAATSLVAAEAGSTRPALPKVRQALVSAIAELSGIDRDSIEPTDELSAYSLDPALLSRLSERINEACDLQTTPADFSGNATLDGIACALCPEQPALPVVGTTRADVDLADLAYTLQLGREAMEERLALVVSSTGELCDKLDAYCRGAAPYDGIHTGNIHRDKDKAELLVGSRVAVDLLKLMIGSRDLEGLARLWTAGVDVDWAQLHAGTERHRIALPGYPFAPDRCWVQLTTGTPTVTPPARSGALFAKRWQADPAPQADSLPDPKGPLLVLVSDESVPGAALPGDRPALVRTVPTDPASAQRLAGDLLLQAPDLAGLVDLSDLTDGLPEPPAGKIALLQALLESKHRAPFFVLHFTRGLVPLENPRPALHGATFAGFARMLAAEYRNLGCRTIDVDLGVDELPALRQVIRRELADAGSETEVCYRRGVRYLPAFAQIAAADLIHPGRLPVDPAKVAVITGGTRGIGAEIARHLAAQGVRKLVLMGRQPVPPRDAWGSLLAGPGSDPAAAARVQLIRDLEAAGASVELYTGPLTDPARLRSFFTQVRERLGAIGGVIHCAGLSLEQNPAFIRKPPEQMQQVFEPKLDGLQALETALADDDLEYFLLFSSISATVPAMAAGLSDYAAANAFMDQFALHRSAAGKRRVISIQWPSWSEVGMGAVRSPVYGQLGLLPLSVTEGLALLGEVMRHGEACVMPLVVDPVRFDPAALLGAPARPAAPAPAAPAQGPNATALASPAQPPTFPAQGPGPAGGAQWLRRLFADQLKIPPERLDEDTPFGDYGVDSVLLADLVQKIEQQVGRKVEPSALLEHPTLRTLAQYLTAEGMLPDDVPLPELSVAASLQPSSPLDPTPAPPPAPPPAAAQPAGRPKVAIIGMACHFPGAHNTREFWLNLAQGRDCITEVPPSRWDVDRFYAPDYQPGKSISKWGGFIDGIEQFDPEFFGIRPEDADQTDPLIRQVLEVSAEAINDAGYERKELSGQRVGVFVGARAGAFAQKVTELRKSSILGIGQNFIATRVSYWLNLKGPSMVVDTACSSSLVSVHLACQSLMSGESSMALAGGVDLLLDEGYYLVLSEGRALSPDGRCHTFDEKANGFVPGEGCGIVVLKLLDQAIADGDRIYAVIDGAAINNDGHNMGVTTPNPEGQGEVIRRAQQVSGVDPASISYVETHGTGTMIGDPIELKALATVFRESSSDRQLCRVGSVKSNFGHLLSAAGVASLIKVTLSLAHRQLPPTLHCERPNPRFRFEDSPFIPCTALTDWEPRHGVRRAGISSFGFGGTNAHMILSDWDSAKSPGYVPGRQPLPPLVMHRKRYWFTPQSAPTPPETRDGGIMVITEETD